MEWKGSESDDSCTLGNICLESRFQEFEDAAKCTFMSNLAPNRLSQYLLRGLSGRQQLLTLEWKGSESGDCCTLGSISPESRCQDFEGALYEMRTFMSNLAPRRLSQYLLQGLSGRTTVAHFGNVTTVAHLGACLESRYQEFEDALDHMHTFMSNLAPRRLSRYLLQGLSGRQLLPTLERQGSESDDGCTLGSICLESRYQECEHAPYQMHTFKSNFAPRRLSQYFLQGLSRRQRLLTLEWEGSESDDSCTLGSICLEERRGEVRCEV